MANKSIDLPGYFICPACVQKDLANDENEFDPVHLEPGRYVAGTRYCTLCAEEMLDVLTIKVNDALLEGPITWGGRHSISLGLRGGEIYKVTVSCPCEHGGITQPFIYNIPGFKGYRTFLAAFVAAHYSALKAIIG